MEIIKEPKALKSLSKVGAKANLKSIFMLKSDFWRSMDAMDFERVGIEIKLSGKLFEERDDCILAKATFSFMGAPVDGGEAKEKKGVASIEAEYILIYSLAERSKLTKEDLEAFCDINSVYNAWPYWREFVGNASDRMGLPIPMLPLLKFRGPHKREEQKDETT